MEIANLDVTDTGIHVLDLDDVQFPGGFGGDVAPLASNKGKPVIAIEIEDGFRLIDGWGRVSGLINAGAEQAQAILISEEDLAERTVGGDDEAWNAAIYARYTSYRYCGTTN
jgi:hypothetical protein